MFQPTANFHNCMIFVIWKFEGHLSFFAVNNTRSIEMPLCVAREELRNPPVAGVQIVGTWQRDVSRKNSEGVGVR